MVFNYRVAPATFNVVRRQDVRGLYTMIAATKVRRAAMFARPQKPSNKEVYWSQLDQQQQQQQPTGWLSVILHSRKRRQTV